MKRTSLLAVVLALLTWAALAQPAGPTGSNEPPRSDRSHASALVGSRIIPSFEALPDPLRWSVDRSTGFRYRRATRLELAENGWPAGTFLVETGKLNRDATRGARKLSLLVPFGDDDAQLVDFDLASSATGSLVIETRAIGSGADALVQSEARRPLFHHYGSRVRSTRSGLDIGGALMVLASSDDGGFSAGGVVRGIDVEVLGPSSAWFLENLAAAGRPVQVGTLAKITLLAAPGTVGSAYGACNTFAICDVICGYLGGPIPWGLDGNVHPCLVPFDDGTAPAGAECVDGVDNDGVGGTDLGDINCGGFEHVHEAGAASHFHRFESGRDFGIFGEAKACTAWDESWDESLWLAVAKVAGAFRREDGPLVEDLRGQVISCWIFESSDDALACDQFGECAPFDSKPHLYPYAGANRDNSAYRSGARADLWHAGFEGLDTPIAVVDVLHFNPVLVDGEGKCGNAFVGAGNSLSGFVVSATGGALCPPTWKVAAHELGHAFGADHEVWPEDPPHTFMTEGNAEGFLPYFSPDNASVVDNCFANYFCPRGGDLGTEPPDP